MSHPGGIVDATHDVGHAAAVARAVERLAAGDVVAFPTDTLYGLAVDPRVGTAVERLFRLKGRDPSVALPLIAGDADQVAAVARPSPLARRLAALFWPGPLTLVLEADPVLDRRVLGGRSTVAVRVPDHVVSRGMARTLGHPITATSANRSGEPACTSAAEVAATLADAVDLIVDGGPAVVDRPSTIVDARAGAPTLVRAGVVPWERVLQSLA